MKDVSPKALIGKSIAVQSATNHSGYLEDVYSRSIVGFYNTVADAYRDLAAGRVEYVLDDKLAIYDWLNSQGACCEIAPTELNDPAYFVGASPSHCARATTRWSRSSTPPSMALSQTELTPRSTPSTFPFRFSSSPSADRGHK